jgi:hypothetical protein
MAEGSAVLRVWSQPDLGGTPILSFFSICATLNKLFPHSVPQFSHIELKLNISSTLDCGEEQKTNI